MDLEKNFLLVKQGAEARLYRGEYLGQAVYVKERFPKKYRHPDLDDHLTRDRIKAEARAIVRCKMAGISTPTLYFVDFHRRCIFMQDIENSVTVRDYMLQIQDEEQSGEKFIQLAKLIGSMLGKMHKSSIIHGDLTTSNMLLRKKSDDYELVLIDFGLSSADGTPEDKGVDLYVLERALLSTHPNTECMFEVILQSYSKEYKKGAPEVLKKLDEVRMRGRKRLMVG